MGRIKPTAQKELEGSFKAHPERRNKNEPVATGFIGDPPDSLHDGERVIWYELIDLACKGVMTNADRVSLEMLCKLVYEMRTAFQDMNASKLSRLTFLLSQFGMTPADRSKISIKKDEDKNPFEGMLN